MTLLEICCGSADDCIRAEQGGADRVELNSALYAGGLTPSIGTLRATKARCTVPIIAMIRPRTGGFCYSEIEFDSMLYDAKALIDSGADGLAFGCLNADGGVDFSRTAMLCEIVHAAGKTAVFHRAIDVTSDWKAAFDGLLKIGIDRVLTSGQAATAIDGADTIRTMREYVGGSMEILPGAGINETNVRALLDKTGCNQAHMSAKSIERDASCSVGTGIRFNSASPIPEDSYTSVDVDKVRRIKESI